MSTTSTPPSASAASSTRPAADAASTGPTDEQILAYETHVKDTDALAHELVSIPLPLSDLLHEYASNAPFLAKIHNLAAQYALFRRCRGDGNCFYRAVVYAWFERVLLRPARYLKRARQQLDDAKHQLLANGFQLLVIEDFLDVAVDTLDALATGAIADQDALLSRFQADHISNALVVLFRFIASAYLQAHADDYAPFILDYADDMITFCNQHVEAMGRESDEIQIIALTKQLQVNVAVAYLDASKSDHATVHRFEGNETDPADEWIHLLYRPGHYDLIYPRS
ncbi:hypothetical protein GGF32_001937 [Allomyces javanicus]|nr:hypothetical protein GGF32_001937 [Allomyces javanicus]